MLQTLWRHMFAAPRATLEIRVHCAFMLHSSSTESSHPDVVRHGYFFKKMDSCLKSNWKAAAFAAKGRFCYTHRAPYVSVSKVNRRKKTRSRSTAKAKTNIIFQARPAEGEAPRSLLFLLVSNNKDPSLKKNFKGSSEKIFLLTRSELRKIRSALPPNSA